MTLYMCDVKIKHRDGSVEEFLNTYWKLEGPLGEVNLDNFAGCAITITRSDSQVDRKPPVNDGGS